MGLDAVIDDPRNVEYRGGKLIVAGAPADLVYKRVLISELVEQMGLDSPVVRAVRDRAVCMVDGFRCKILHKKASLAVLSDEVNAGMFPLDERLAIAGCIPWTRVVAERTTTWRGAAVDLMRLILDLREWLVLKPNDEYGGKGITLGWTVDAATWETGGEGRAGDAAHRPGAGGGPERTVPELGGRPGGVRRPPIRHLALRDQRGIHGGALDALVDRGAA